MNPRPPDTFPDREMEAILGCLGAEALGKAAGNPNPEGEAKIDAEELAAYLEGRLDARRRREVQHRLRESAPARAQLAEMLASVRGTEYGESLLAQAETRPSRFPFFPALVSLLSPRVLAPLAAAAVFAIVAVSSFVYAQDWERRALERSASLADRGEFAQAREALVPVLSRAKPSSPTHKKAETQLESLFRQEGRSYDTKGDYAGAARVYEEGAQTVKHDEDLWTRAAQAQWKDAREKRNLPAEHFVAPADSRKPSLTPAEARSIEQALREALRIDPKYLPALKTQAQVEIESGRLDDAQRTLGAAQAEAPRDPEVLNSLGRLFAAKGQTQEAERCYEKALQAAPDYPDAHANLARLFEAQGQPQRAAPHQKKLEEKNLGNLFQ
ncbi:MAG: tetratricopeptide repeat protein [Candidatus Sumerlaeota bacterium]|nr:tetratricopeptide repeat protein [Candidatus Sumerlaeota bacterium]